MSNDGRLFEGVPDKSYVYFVHSYYLRAEDEKIVKASTDYGVKIHASVEKDNIFAYVAGDDLHNGHLLGMYTGNASTSQIFDDAGNLIPYVSASQSDKQDYTPFKDYANLDEDYKGNYETGTNGQYILDEEGFRIIQYKKDAETGKFLLDENGNKIPDYLLDTNGNKTPDVSEHNRMYGHANAMESITTARTIGITKSVRADANEDADYTARTSVIEKNDYTYKIHIDRTEQGQVHNFIIFDKLENITPGTWKGTFNSIDLEEFNTLYGNISPAPNPQKYYSESHDAPTVLYIKSKNEDGNPTVYTINKDDLESTQFTEKNQTIVKDEWRATWNWKTVNELKGIVFLEKTRKKMTFTKKHGIPKRNGKNIKNIRKILQGKMWKLAVLLLISAKI